ncbi:hypothetical protein FDECE_3844 [Fusarium decemcellulare]|nr:hypothetical protein FDECE_3844 [Fusarium decemcellulare]
MAPNLKNIIFSNIRNHQSTTVLEQAMKTKDGDTSTQSEDTEAMLQDRHEATQKREKEKVDKMDDAAKTPQHSVDGMTDEQLSRISIRIQENDDPKDEDASGDAETLDEKDEFNKYKHHQYVRRWGLFKDSDGLDEEWFIPDPPILAEDDPAYLCNMCRHIDFATLLSKRGLPGNQQPGPTSIHLLGIWKVMKNDNCSFCRLLRRKILEDKLVPDLPQEELVRLSFDLNVLDDGPDYALRLEIEIPDEERGDVRSRFVVHKIAGSEEEPLPLQGLEVGRDTASMSQLKSWLSVDDGHGQPEQREHLGPLMSTIRLVDTTDNCIREVDIPCEYVCLSYVWGTGSQTQYTTDTKTRLEALGGLTEASASLPQTILDAMQVTREVGLRYIWIDALCITQDDSEDKAAIISKMGTIYGNAAFTIMASTNSNPTDGLPGVGVPRSREQIVEKVQGMTLGVALHDARQRHAEIEDGLWNSRAWTFQERVLSQRAVFFTSSQMCFVSPQGAAFEDTVPVADLRYKATPYNDQTQFSARLRDLWMRIWRDPTQSRYINKGFETEDGITIFVGEDPDKPGEAAEDAVTPLYQYKAIAGNESIDAPLIEGLTLWDAYAQGVNSYTRRNMTWQSDAVNAFVGIADLIRQGTNTKFWHGMPEFAFTQSLLWQPKEPLKRRVTPDGSTLFPSWTWAAWQGHVSYRGRGWHNAVGFAPGIMVQWLKEVTIDEWLEDFKMSGERTEKEIEECLRQLQGARLRLMKPHPASLLHFDYERYGWEVDHDKVRNQHIFVHEAYPGVKLSLPICLPGQEIVELPSEDGVLYFQARTTPARFYERPHDNPVKPLQDTFLQVGLNDEDRSANYRRPWQFIIYHQGYRAGFLSLNVPLEELNLDPDQKIDGEDAYSIVAISCDSLPHIAPPLVGWDMYWSGDPQLMQEKTMRDEWTAQRDRPEAPDEDATPSDDVVNENGDPRWDEGRFGTVSILDVCNVLLVKNLPGGFSERIGSGKMSYCAFYGAKPDVDLVKLR